MSLNGAVLYNSTGQYLNLNDFAGGYGIDWSAAIGHSDIRRTITKPWQRGYDPLSAVSWGNRVIKLPLHFGGTSLDSWSQNYQCVRNILAESERWYASNGTDGAQTWLAVQLNGQTNPLVFDVIGGDIDIDSGPQKYFGPTMASTTSPKLPSTPVILFCRPFAHPQAQQNISSTTLGNGNNQTYPTNYTQPTALGNWEPPARFSITPNSDYNMLIVARRSQGNVANFIWPYLANTSSARTGYTTSVGAFTGPSTTSYPWYPGAANTPTFTNTAGVTASYMGTVSRWSGNYNNTNWIAATYTFTVSGNLIDQIGNHRVIVAFSSNSFSTYGLGSVGCQLTYGGTDGRAVALPTSTYFPGGANFYNTSFGQFILDAGVLPVTFPQTGTPGQFKFCVHIWGLPINAGASGVAQNLLDVDAVFPMPLDEQQFQYHAAYTLTGGTGVTFTDMTANTTFVKDDISLLPSFTNLDTAGDQTGRVLVPDYDSGRFLMPLAPSRWFPLWWRYSGGGTTTVSISNFYTGTSTLNIRYTPLFEVTN
jgi:hypothetical protein